MTSFNAITGGREAAVAPEIRKIGFADLKEALAKGLDDFRAMPSHFAFLIVIYFVIGALLYPATSGQNVLPLVFPLLAGYALVGPFAAVGLYEVSRRRELGLPCSWSYAFGVLRSPAIPSILAVGLALMLIFVLWLATAQALYGALFHGWAPQSIGDFLGRVFGTPQGLALIVAGTAIGFVYAVVAFSIGAISFPLLLDRDIGAAAAVSASVRAVVKNPVVMAAWGLIVAAGLLAGVLTLFVGLAVITPILGHATWHLYRALCGPPGA